MDRFLIRFQRKSVLNIQDIILEFKLEGILRNILHLTLGENEKEIVEASFSK